MMASMRGTPNCHVINYAALAEQPDSKGVYVTDHLPVMVDLVLN
ncbi:MAG TPA: hypothetical protein PLK40_06185 [Bacteroidaceae bacterium]|nr:hypothetical protein [Bacteroidaceae bacterium]